MFVVYMKFSSWFVPLVFFDPITAQSFHMSRANFLKSTGTSVLSSGTDIFNWPNNNNGPEEEESSLPLTYSFKEEADASYPLILNFYSPVTIESCMALTSYLKQLDVKSKQLHIQYGKVFPINLHIQSGGGMLMPTFYVCDVIHNMDTPVHVYIDGFVASAASLIAVSGKKRYMTKHSFMLIHQLQSQSSGRLNEMKDEITNLDFFMRNAKDIYYQNSNITKEVLEKLLLDELWIDAQECLKYDLIDEII
jgi:ATP-dependent protease ClpP protease subunit